MKNATKDQIWIQKNIQVTGPIIDLYWYGYLTFSNGKPALPALLILADFMYWSKAKKMEEKGTIVYKSLIKGDYLFRSTKQYTMLYGLSEQQIRNAFKLLQEKQLLTYELVSSEENPDIILGRHIIGNLENIKKMTDTHVDDIG